MTFTVVLDIDGVLYHSQQGASKQASPIKGAQEVLDRLQADAVPHFFLTNGTGYTDAGKAAQMSELFGRELPVQRFVLPTTPMRELLPELQDKRVLVVAKTGKQGQEIAASIGFRNVTTVQEYAARHPELLPCKRFDDSAAAAAAAGQCSLEEEPAVAAVLLFEIPADWYEAVQICVDVVRTRNGRPGLENELGPAETQVVAVHSGNPDLEFASLHSVPRMTLGAFRRCLEGLYHDSTGRQLQLTLSGKPYAKVYNYIEQLVQEQHAGEARGHYYMIGDSIKSDIPGAVAAGWQAVLVRTGCYKGQGQHEAHCVTDNVFTALQWIYEREGRQW